MDERTKYKIISLLDNEQNPKDIAADLGVGYASVLRIKKEFEEAKENNTIDTLVNIDKLVITKAAEDLGVEEHHVEQINKGLAGLEALAEDLQTTALALNTRVKNLVMSAEHPSELQVYADILCQLQTAFVNKNLTQVNVQNNFGGDANPQASRYSQYLGDAPGA